MKKYIVPTIKVQKIELTDLLAASPQFTTDNISGGTPIVGTSEEKNTEGGPGHEAEGYSKGYNAWDAWEE